MLAGASTGAAAAAIGPASLITHQSFGMLGSLTPVLGGLAFVGQALMERFGNHPV